MPFARSYVALALTAAVAVPLAAQDAGHIVFRSSVDVVSITAVVRDSKGRVVPSLTSHDFEVLDGGQPRQILDLFSEQTAPASVALLIDGSGSMRIGAANEASRQISEAVLNSMDAQRDDAALLSFDTRLITLQSFTHDFDAVRRGLGHVESWGSTSLFDSIAGAAGMVANRTRNRRAVVVLTDGADTTSAYTPERVSAIASSIDVPVYVFALGDQPERFAAKKDAVVVSPLLDLARETGGEYFVANTPLLVNAGIKRLLEELRHQYVIGFEASAISGLRHVEVRTRKNDLNVRSRKWYSTNTGE
jgi:VWFA-related protein